MENSYQSQKHMEINSRTDNEIDLKQVAAAMIRNKALIAKVTAVTFLFSGIFLATRKPIWQGQFEIVLSSKQPSASPINQLIQSNQSLANLIGSSKSSNQLETEVQILESPSVLKPVFDYVKKEKQKKGTDTKQWRYANWINDNLTIELVKGTSVLELSYRDNDKELILPVMQKISDAYQTYSGRDRERGLNQSIKYLREQVKIYNLKSVNSLRAVQEYGIEHDLISLQDGGSNNPNSNSSLNIESIRITAANRIRNINEKLKQLNQLKNDSEAFMYVGRYIPELAAQELPRKLDQIDSDLALLRVKYVDDDDSIRTLLENRRQLLEVFKKQTYGYLYAQRMEAQSLLKAAERPKGVLLKYRELMRTAARDEITLTNLESKLQVLTLEKARKEDPWELISTPTLLDSPVAPRKKQILIFGLLAGLIAGSGTALLVDRRKGFVFSKEELESLLPCPLIKHLPAMAQDAWTDAADLLAAGPLKDGIGDNAIALIPLGKIPNDQLQTFSSEIRRALDGRELLVSNDLRETSQCATQLLVTAPGAATRNQISQFCQKLALQGAPLAGWVLIDPQLKLE